MPADTAGGIAVVHNSNVNSYQAADTIIPVTDISCKVTDAHFAVVTAYQAANIIISFY
jgi:hypothetical protein